MLCYNERISLGWDYPWNPGHTKNPVSIRRPTRAKHKWETRSKDKTGTNKTYPGPGEIFGVRHSMILTYSKRQRVHATRSAPQHKKIETMFHFSPPLLPFKKLWARVRSVFPALRDSQPLTRPDTPVTPCVTDPEKPCTCGQANCGPEPTQNA